MPESGLKFCFSTISNHYYATFISLTAAFLKFAGFLEIGILIYYHYHYKSICKVQETWGLCKCSVSALKQLLIRRLEKMRLHNAWCDNNPVTSAHRLPLASPTPWQLDDGGCSVIRSCLTRDSDSCMRYITAFKSTTQPHPPHFGAAEGMKVPGDDGPQPSTLQFGDSSGTHTPPWSGLPPKVPTVTVVAPSVAIVFVLGGGGVVLVW